MTQTAPFPKLKRGLVAILRGLKPDEAVAIGQAVFEAGIEAIEVPLNSPEPFVVDRQHRRRRCRRRRWSAPARC